MRGLSIDQGVLIYSTLAGQYISELSLDGTLLRRSIVEGGLSNIASGDQLPYLSGDLNFDGAVRQGDLDAVLTGWGSSEVASSGFLPDGVMDQNELDAVLLNWGNNFDTSQSRNVVPEPTAATMAIFSMMVLSRRRRS